MASIVPQTIGELEKIASAFAASGMFPDAKTMGQAFVKIMAGQEYGIGPFASMTSIHIIEGKPTLSATAVGGLIKRSGKYDYKVVTSDDTSCLLEFYERGELLGTSKFDLSDAARAGLSSKAVWVRYPKAMTFSRAMTAGARKYCPDVFEGYTPEELDAPLTETGELAEPAIKNVTPAAPEAAPVTVMAPRKPLTLPKLVELYEDAQTLNVVPGGRKLGPWLEASGIAPGLSARIDAQTGKRQSPSDEELFAAEDVLRNLIENAEQVASLEPPAPAAPVPPADAPVEEQAPVDGVSTGQRMRIMAMFNAAGMTGDAYRYKYTADILGEDKTSIKSWTQDDYRKISDALEARIEGAA